MTASESKAMKSGSDCPACGAAQRPGAIRCWLCGDELPMIAEVAEETPFAPVAAEANPWLLHGGIWLAVALCALILFGLLLGDNKYYAIGFVVMVTPALLIALGGATLGRALGKPWHPLVKGAVGGAIAAVLLPVALVVALFIACTDLCSGKL